MLTVGEMQALKMLIALQCLAEAGPRPALGYVCQCVKSIVHPMVAIGISFTTHAVLTSAPLICSSQSASLETDVSMADISSLPLSIGSAGDLVRRAETKAAMEVSITALMDTPSETPTENTVVDQEEKGDKV